MATPTDVPSENAPAAATRLDIDVVDRLERSGCRSTSTSIQTRPRPRLSSLLTTLTATDPATEASPVPPAAAAPHTTNVLSVVPARRDRRDGDAVAGDGRPSGHRRHRWSCSPRRPPTPAPTSVHCHFSSTRRNRPPPSCHRPVPLAPAPSPLRTRCRVALFVTVAVLLTVRTPTATEAATPTLPGAAAAFTAAFAVRAGCLTACRRQRGPAALPCCCCRSTACQPGRPPRTCRCCRPARITLIDSPEELAVAWVASTIAAVDVITDSDLAGGGRSNGQPAH